MIVGLPISLYNFDSDEFGMEKNGVATSSSSLHGTCRRRSNWSFKMNQKLRCIKGILLMATVKCPLDGEVSSSKSWCPANCLLKDI